MLLWETLGTAWKALGASKLRTALTTLGMVIGVGAVVTMLAMGEGARAMVEGKIRSLGTNLLSVTPGAPARGPVRTGSVETLTWDDARAIAELREVARVSPESMGSAQVRYLAKNMTSGVVGATVPYLAVHSYDLTAGTAFSDNDLLARRRVAIIGANVARTLFGNLSPVGERIQIKGMSFKVLGVLEEKGNEGFSSPDDQILVPLSTHQAALFGRDYLSSIALQVASEEATSRVQTEIKRLLRLRHRLGASAEDDFDVRSQQEMLQVMGQVIGIFTALLGSVAAVSLLVGGIGIMNIMLVSVGERTREIGLRMAVGARRRNILLQFLVESVIVSVAGGLVGLGLGAVGAAGVASVAGWPMVVPVYAVVLALATSFGVGLVFGVSPARRAARLDPVEALLHE
ncbi:MAG: ABC transporter permease [Deltaproteobacteria bacterium]|nr:ABC transporter permease [Deltaproteobacteria bacterium]